jgi:hypothetical protein
MDDINQLIKRFNVAKSRSYQWIDLFDEAYSYAVPNRNTIDSETPGSIKNAFVYDTTLVHATDIFVSKIHNALTPQGMKWATLIGGTNLTESQQQDISQQLDVVTNILFQYLNSSNFDLAINEAYYDLAVSTGFLQVHEGDDAKPLKFEAVPLTQVYPEEGARGTLDTFWRDYIGVTNRNIELLWPDAVISEELRERINQAPDNKTDLIEGTLFVPSDKEGTPDTYRYVVIEPKSKSLIVDRQDLPSSVWVAFRWSKTPGELYGRGPVIKALPSAQTLNKIAEYELKQAEISLYPPFMAFETGVFSPYNFVVEPNVVIPVDPIGATNEWPIKSLETNPNIQFGQMLVNDLRTQINNIMLGNPLGPVDAPVRTATEMQLRQQNLLEVASPAIGRLQAEELSPLIDRCLYILTKKGILPEIKINGKDVAIKYASPITQNQGEEDVQTFMTFYQQLASIYGPQLSLAIIDTTQLPFWMGQKLNADLSLIKKPDELQTILQNFSQAQPPQAPAQTGGGPPTSGGSVAATPQDAAIQAPNQPQA